MSTNNKQWTEVIITVPNSQLETAQAIATQFTNGGFYIEEYKDLLGKTEWQTTPELISEELLQKPTDIALLHLYFSHDVDLDSEMRDVKTALQQADVDYSVEVAYVDEENWASVWKQHYHVTEVSNRLAVVPNWESYTGDKTPIRLDPGMAFGTGTHESTLLCLYELDDLIKGGETVLDVGTGSGILGVASVLLGAESALGIDIDPVAVSAANSNAALNKVQDRFTARQGDLTTDIHGGYDIIVANIIADVVIELTPDVPALLNPGGIFLTSGIIDFRAGDVEKALEAAGFIDITQRHENDWVSITCRKP